jgi:tripartite-type tricarboxylate transporter receptor subunit TctC
VKPIRILVGFTPGAGIDIALRLVTPKMSEVLGQQIIVDNRPGAGGNLAAEIVARSSADGYTLLTNGAPAAIAQTLYPKLGYDLLRDLEAAALIASVAQLLVVHPALPVQSVKALVALGKAGRNELTYASTGAGSTPHLSAEMLRLNSGMRLVHIPYRGSPQALTDLVSGQVSFMFANLLSVVPQVQQGRLRALAITSSKRSVLTPEVPTVAETYPGYESGSWYGLFAPAGTPPVAITRINEAVARAKETPEVRDKLLAQGAELLTGTPQEAHAYTRSEVMKWARVVKASGAKAE